MLFFLWWYIIDCLQWFKALYAAFFTFKINTYKNLELKQSNEYMWQLGVHFLNFYVYIEIYHCRNIFSKHRKNQKLAPGMLNVKTSQGKKKVDSKIQRL